MANGRAEEPGGGRPGIRTFLIADVRGYTLFTQERGDEEAAKLAARFAEVCRDAIGDYGGSVIELRGDEALAVFDSARQAIRASTVLQRRFAEETEADPTLPLPVGIGLDAGEAVPVEGGYRGGALNLAARLCGRAGPGEILASQGVLHLARRVDRIKLVDQGELHLKGLEEPVRVFRVISEDEDTAEQMKRLLPTAPARERAPLRLARQHPLLAAMVALALVALAVVPTTFALRGSDQGPILSGDALAMLDLGGGGLEGSTALESRPGDIAVGAGGVWVALPDRGAVIRIDPETMTVSDTIPVGADPSGIAIGNGSVWVSNGGSSTVSRISPETDSVVQTIDVPGGPAGIAFGQGGVWVANSFNASVSHIDPETGTEVATIGVGDRPADVVVDENGVWVSNAASDSVSRVDPARDLEVQTIPVGSLPDAIAAGPEGVWVANLVDGTVSHIDPDTNSVVQTIQVGDTSSGLSLAGDAVWVADGSGGSVTSIESETATATTIPLGSGTEDIATGDGAVWVTVREAPAAHRGGTLRVGVLGPIHSLDPAIAYAPESWAVVALTNDGLVRFQHTGGIAGTRLVPDLARSLAKPTNGGKTYTFQLRSGLRYSTGEPVRPQDFQRAIERVFANLDDGDPTGGVQYFSQIVGAQDCEPGNPCDLSQGILSDEDASTVTFRLTEPDPDFLYKLALPFAFAVPEETPDALGKGDTIPATGPYVIRRVSKEVVVLDRNPEFRTWSEAARPDGFPDRIEWRIGTDPNRIVEEVLAGHADLNFYLPPADRITELQSSHAGQLHFFPAAQTFYMNLDLGSPPFNDPTVRRALNFAVDRQQIAEIFGGGARPTCQILPPNFTGYVPYCPYTRHPDGEWTAPDLETAVKLVSRSGTAGSSITVFGTKRFPESMPAGRYFSDLLNDLGYRSTFKVVPVDTYFSAIYDPPRRPDVALLAWQTDYVAESGFIPPLLSCGRSTNTTGFCDPSLDRRMKSATRLQLTDPAAARSRWSSIEHEIVDRAPWVSLVNPYLVHLVSERVGNFQVNPQWGPLVDQMWVQ